MLDLTTDKHMRSIGEKIIYLAAHTMNMAGSFGWKNDELTGKEKGGKME